MFQYWKNIYYQPSCEAQEQNFNNQPTIQPTVSLESYQANNQKFYNHPTIQQTFHPESYSTLQTQCRKVSALLMGVFVK